jgi:hypothetical protein
MDHRDLGRYGSMRCQRLRPAIFFQICDTGYDAGASRDPAAISRPNWTFQMREHRFSIGQSVRLPNRLGMLKTNELVFTVTAKMPAKDRSPQYRIRSEEERHERVVTEDMLQAVAQQLEIVDAAEQLFAPKEKRALSD